MGVSSRHAQSGPGTLGGELLERGARFVEAEAAVDGSTPSNSACQAVTVAHGCVGRVEIATDCRSFGGFLRRARGQL